jgi:hypothetical protein
MLYRGKICSGKVQLQSAVEKLFHAYDFDVEDIIVYRQLVYDAHIEIASTTSTTAEFSDKICRREHLATTHHYAAML